MDFAQLLLRFDALLHRHRPAYRAQLNPPAPTTELAALEAEFQVVLPPELRQWFGWHNGQPAGCFENLVGSYEFPTVADVADTMRINGELLAAGDFVPNWWRPGWLPFLTNGSGDHLCLDLKGTFTNSPGQIIEHWHDYEARTVVFPSLTAWLTAALQAYETAAGTTALLSDEEVFDLELESPKSFPLEFMAG